MLATNCIKEVMFLLRSRQICWWAKLFQGCD